MNNDEYAIGVRSRLPRHLSVCFYCSIITCGITFNHAVPKIDIHQDRNARKSAHLVGTFGAHEMVFVRRAVEG